MHGVFDAAKPARRLASRGAGGVAFDEIDRLGASNMCISALNIPARMHRYRRFGPDLTVDAARLAEKRGRLLLSFHGTLTRYPSTSWPGAPILTL